MAEDLDNLLESLKIEETSSSLSSYNTLIQQIINILRPFIESGNLEECLPKILTPTVMSTIRESLLLLVSTNLADPILAKRGMYVLKSIVSYLIEPKSSTIRDNLLMNENVLATEILLTLGYKKFKNFWQLFFDVYDILNETQPHIITPFVKRIQNSNAEFQQHPEVTPWLVILEIKMMMHDNRIIAKNGLELFLNFVHPLSTLSNISTNNNNTDKNSTLLYYLQTTVFPIIREKVFWILPEAVDFYHFADKLGKLVERVSDQDLPVQTLLNYIKTSSKGFGTASLYFYILAAKSCVVEMLEHQKLKFNSTPSSSLSSSSITKDNYNDVFIQILTTVSDIIMCRLVSCDKFLKKKMQVLLLEILLLLQPQNSIQFHFSQLNTNQEEAFFYFFTLLGSLDKDIFCTYRHLLMPHLLSLSTNNEAKVQDINNQETSEQINSTASYFKWILQEDEKYVTFHKEILHKLRSFKMPLKFKGFFRWIVLHFQQQYEISTSNQLENSKHHKEDDEKELGDRIRMYTEQLLDPSFISTLSTEQIQSILDFTKIIVTIQKEVQKSNANSHPFVPVIQFLFRTAFVSLIEFVRAGHVSNSTCNVNFIRTESLLSIVQITNDFKEDQDLKMITEAQSLLANGITEYTNLAYLVLLKTSHLSNSGIQSNEKLMFSDDWLSIVFQKCLDEKMKLDLYSAELVGQNIEVKHRFISKVNDLKLWTLSNVVLKRQNGEGNKDVQIIENKHQFLSEVMSTVFDLIETGTHLGLIQIFLTLQQILNEAFILHFDDIIQQIVDFVPEAWKHTMELQTSRYFWEVFNAFCVFVTQPYFSGYQILSQYWAKILELSENISGLIYSFTCALKNVCEWEDFCDRKTRLLYDDYLMELLSVNVDIACTTPVLFKSVKVAFNLWSYLCTTQTDEKEISTNYDETLSIPFSGNNKSRIIAILNILNLYHIKKSSSSFDSSSDSEHVVFLNGVVDKLLEMNEFGCAERRTNFSGSYFHRFRQRIMQLLLVLQPFYNQSISAKVLKNILTAIGHEAPLTSVRYLCEWVIIKVLIAYPELQEEFFKIAEERLCLRVGFGAFYSTILLHAAQHIKFDCNNPFFQTSLQRTSDLLMNQNFSVRIYGNITLTNIFEKIQRTNYEPLIIRYQAVYDSAKRAVETAAGNFMKIFTNAVNDFYISKFDAVNHFFYDVLFILLPRITLMCDEEIIHRHDLKAIITKHSVYHKFQLPLESPPEIQQLYLKEEEYVFPLRPALIDGREQGEEASGLMGTSEENSDAPSILQWKYLPTSEDILDFPEEVQLKKRSHKDKLILVASLIENLPNLGGLCRTSEIFGVSKYVISNFKVLEDIQFKSLSVHSHRWVDILEVNKCQLPDFLKDYSSRGYSIVAIEQSNNSVKLNDFKFPEKTVLLLGNEKSGIPTELFHLVDYCVEIPQHGLTRSLNVHVSGSLVLYTYATQHILQ